MSNAIQNTFIPVSVYCDRCLQYYTGVHQCPANWATPPGLVSEDRLRQIVAEAIAQQLYNHQRFLKELIREAIAEDRDAQIRDYANRKRARERDEEEMAREKEEQCSRLKSV